MKRIVSAGAALLLFFFWACATDGTATAPGDLSSGSGDSRPGGGDTDPDTDSGNADGGAASWSLDEARQTAAGLYKGIMPYPGREGLETVIQLRQNGTYMIRSRVVGKVDNPVELTGTFDIDRNWIVRLDKTAVDTVSPVYVLDPGLEPPTLTQLDNEAKPFSGDGSGRYVLKKFPAMITETYWKLVSIYGRQVVWTGDPKREPHIILRLDGYKISGHSGTNSFSGTYKVKDGNGISFPPMRSTMIASPNMKIEMDLYKAFDETDSYTLHENRFSIGKRGREPSAVFEAVYLR